MANSFDMSNKSSKTILAIIVVAIVVGIVITIVPMIFKLLILSGLVYMYFKVRKT